MINILKYVFVLWAAAGCGAHGSPVEDKTLAPGGPYEKNAVAVVKRLAVQHGYRPEKMNLEVKSNSETGDFLIFLFPKPIDTQHLRREFGLFAIVHAKTGQVIRFSDPAVEPKR